MREVVIVDSVRTGLAKSFRGKFNMTRPDDMAAHCVDALLVRSGTQTERREIPLDELPVGLERDNDPALLEWIDARTVRARIFPVPALGERRVVLRYQQMLTESEGKLRYRYPLSGPPGREAAAIEEFSLEVQLRGGLEQDYTLATLGEARVEPDNRVVLAIDSGRTMS